MAIVALAGGSARATSLGQVVVLAATTIAVACWLALVTASDDRRLRPACIFLGACAALICLQLIPLPPTWWRRLPGREAYATVAAVTGTASSWRPISVAPDLTWSSLFALLVPAALLIGLSRLSSRRRAALMLPIAVLTFASGVLGLAQVSGGPTSPLRWYGGNPDPSAIGFFANRNHQALLLSCALPILAALASVPASIERTRGQRRGYAHWTALGVGAFMVLMLPTTGSRAGLVLGGVAILLSAAIAAPQAKARLSTMKRQRRRWLVLSLAGAIVAFIAILVFLGKNVAFSRITDLDPMADQRFRALPVVLDITRTYLPWGAGFGTFDPVFRHFEPFGLLKLTYFNQAHDDIIQLMLEGGFLAALLLASFILWWAIATIRAWRTAASLQALAARAGSAVILLCLLASFVDYPLRTPLMLFVFCLAGVWLLTPVRGPDERSTAAAG